ncbi:MAG: response regulator [Chloroflexota bacterium]
MAEKILIVDDDIDSLKLIGLMLQRHGYEVVAANAGNQAISKAAGELPDLIILDVMMPDMDGYEVTQRLRSDTSTRDIPIIMFTAKTLIDDKVKAFELGADDYLTKPTHPAELASRVKAILARNPHKDAEKVSSTKSIGVLGVKGGVGTTTIAANLAAALMQAGEDPILADFCLGFGTLGLFLGHTKAASMATLLSKQPAELNERVVEDQLTRHQSGMKMLLASPRPKESLLPYTPETATRLIKILKELSSAVVLDLGSQSSPAISRVARSVDQLLLVVEPNRVALAMARELFQSFEGDGVDRNRLNVAVVNRTQSTLQTPWQEIEQVLGQEIKAIVTAEPDLAFQSLEAGIPMVLFRPNSIAASQLVKLAEDFRAQMNAD